MNDLHSDGELGSRKMVSDTFDLPAQEAESSSIFSGLLVIIVALVAIAFFAVVKKRKADKALLSPSKEEIRQRRIAAAARYGIKDKEESELSSAYKIKRKDEEDTKKPRRRRAAAVRDDGEAEGEYSTTLGDTEGTTTEKKSPESIRKGKISLREKVAVSRANRFEAMLIEDKKASTDRTNEESVSPSRQASGSGPRMGKDCQSIQEYEDERKVAPLSESAAEEAESAVSNPKGNNGHEALKGISKKRKKIAYPPVQVLCEVLSQSFKCHVTVVSDPEAGTWGGERWIKRPSDYSSSNSTTITLPFHCHRPTSTKENEWGALVSAFPDILGSSSKIITSKLFARKDVRKVILCHTRADNLRRDGCSLLNIGDDGLDEMKDCMKVLSMWLAKRVAAWVGPEVKTLGYLEVGNENEDEGPDLFSDDYNTNSPSSSGLSASDKGPLNALFKLLEEAETIVSRNFLEDLFTAYGEIAEQDAPLPGVLLTQALNRLVAAKQSTSFTAHHINAVSNLLVASRSVGRCLSGSFQNEIEQMSEKNGRQIQDLVRLAPLFESAAYSVPAAGAVVSERGAFTLQLEELDDFPICVFRPAKNKVYEPGRVMEQGRRTMQSAREVAQSVLRIAFKECGKERVFKWLSNIICSK